MLTTSFHVVSKSYETGTGVLNQRLCSAKALSRCHGEGLLIRNPNGLPAPKSEAVQTWKSTLTVIPMCAIWILM